MQPNDKEPKRDTIESFFGSGSSKKKKGDISTSAIDKSLHIAESHETACCSTDEPSEISITIFIISNSSGSYRNPF